MNKPPMFFTNEKGIAQSKTVESSYSDINFNFKLVRMPPLAYLHMAGWPPEEHGGRKYQLGVWYYGNWSPDSIIEALKEGDPLPPVTFLMGVPRKGYPGTHQDGKNRAYWSWKLGVKEIPVLINDIAEETVAKYSEKYESTNESKK